MKRFHKILVPVDFSTHSAEAVAVAADLAHRYDAKVGLIHVYQPVIMALPDGYTLYTANQLSDLMGELSRHLELARKQAVTKGAPSATAELCQGAPHHEIVKVAEDGHYDLIVMGTHGRTGFMHALLGSVAEKVIRKAHCPVMTVREPAR